jgi:hypothetical protein
MKVSIYGSLREIVAREGAMSLWKGNFAVCVRVFPYSAIQYVAYDWFKSKIYDKNAQQVTPFQRLSAGACAGKHRTLLGACVAVIVCIERQVLATSCLISPALSHSLLLSLW